MYVDTARLTTAISPLVQEALDLPTVRRRLRVQRSQIISVERAVLDRFVIAGFPETEVAPLTVYVAPVQFVDGRIGMNYLNRFQRVCYDFGAENSLVLKLDALKANEFQRVCYDFGAENLLLTR